MPDFIGDKEETTHSCATCKFGKPQEWKQPTGVVCKHPDRLAWNPLPWSDFVLDGPLMQPDDVCELWEAQ